MKRCMLSVMFLLGVFCSLVSAATLVVGPGETYTTIQGAVDAAADGDTISVNAGAYNESVDITTDNLSLVANGVVTITGDGANPAISFASGLNGSVNGFVIDGNSQYGIYFGGGTPTGTTIIQNNTISNCTDGFYASYGYNEGTFTFQNNTISLCTGNGAYIYGFDGAVVRILKNKVTDCDTGLDIEEISEGVETDCVVSDNTITATAGFTGTYGFSMCCAEKTTTVKNNTVTGDWDYGMYFEDMGCCGIDPFVFILTGNYVDTGDGYGFYFDEFTCCFDGNVTITKNTVTNNDVGIYISSHSYEPGSNVDISDNNIYGNTTYGLENVSGEDIPVDDNWWGDPSGPSGDGPGTGDAITTTATSVPTTFLDSAVKITKSGGGGGCAVGTSAASGIALLAMACFMILKRKK